MLGERIREIRKKNKMSQIEFSKRIGVSQGTLSELEQTKYNPSLETILALIQEFNLDSTWLLFGNKIREDEIVDELNPFEKRLIVSLRKLTVRDQKEILDIIDIKNIRTID